jgi:hypothetical protein
MSLYPGSPGNVTILFVAANPKSAERLWLDEEIREITQRVLATSQRDFLTFHQIWAARPSDLLQALNQYTPDIVHFSAHGNPTGELLLLDDRRNAAPIDDAALEALFTTLKDNVRVVVLNACYSERQAKVITKVIDCAVGMQAQVYDRAAILFSSAFYQALGFGRSVQDAFNQGKVAVQLEGVPGHNIPQLLVKKDVKAHQIYLIHDVQERNRQSKSQQRIDTIESSIRGESYQSAYREVMSLLRETFHELSAQEQARIKYLEALIHLSGKRPSVQSPSVMKQAEELMQSASSLHNLFSYKKILALFKQDFARNGLQAKKYREDARKLLSQAERLQVKPEDQEILDLFARSQPQLARDYRHLLSQ